MNARFRGRFPGTFLESGSEIPDGDISIGEGTYGRPIIRGFGNRGAVTIGRYCSIGEGVLILAGGNHDTQRPALYPFRSMTSGRDVDAISKGPISIGHDVWIGARAIILSGVNIGNGAVVGAGAVVTRDVPPFSIAVGNPAKAEKFRFGQHEREALERIAWWNWTAEQTVERHGDFYLPLCEFIAKYDS